MLLSNITAYCRQVSLQCAATDVRIVGVKFPEWAGLSDWRLIDEYTVELKAVDLRDVVKLARRTSSSPK